jgi:hypothetical protein
MHLSSSLAYIPPYVTHDEGWVMSSRRLSRLQAKAVELACRPALNFFDLAESITSLHAEDSTTISTLANETGMSRRRLYYLLEVGQLIASCKVSKPDAEEIGWTKLQIIARHIRRLDSASSSEIRQVFEMASAHKARDLAAALEGRRVIPRRAVQFYLNLGGRAELNEALVKFGATQVRRGLQGKEAALIKLVRAAAAGKPDA